MFAGLIVAIKLLCMSSVQKFGGICKQLCLNPLETELRIGLIELNLIEWIEWIAVSSGIKRVFRTSSISTVLIVFSLNFVNKKER